MQWSKYHKMKLKLKMHYNLSNGFGSRVYSISSCMTVSVRKGYSEKKTMPSNLNVVTDSQVVYNELELLFFRECLKNTKYVQKLSES